MTHILQLKSGIVNVVNIQSNHHYCTYDEMDVSRHSSTQHAILTQPTSQYSPIQPSEFRLLRALDGYRPHYELVSATIGEAPVYYALSYRWGRSAYRRDRPTSVTCHIILNQIATEVSENLYDALTYLYTRLRASGHLIWIDALCIDQHNLAERSSQVLHMRLIYEQADSLWIWLGVPYDDVENNMAVQKMKHLHTVLMNAMDVTDRNVVGALSMIRSDDPLIFPEPGTDCYRAWQGIMRLCELTWWKRAWVYQEATSPNEKSRLFFSGQACFGWKDAFAATEIAGHLGKFTDLDRKFVQIISEGSAERIWKFVLRREKTEKLGWLEALHRFRLTDSTEPRDKVYAP